MGGPVLRGASLEDEKEGAEPHLGSNPSGLKRGPRTFPTEVGGGARTGATVNPAPVSGPGIRGLLSAPHPVERERSYPARYGGANGGSGESPVAGPSAEWRVVPQWARAGGGPSLPLTWAPPPRAPAACALGMPSLPGGWGSALTDSWKRLPGTHDASLALAHPAHAGFAWGGGGLRGQRLSPRSPRSLEDPRSPRPLPPAVRATPRPTAESFPRSRGVQRRVAT